MIVRFSSGCVVYRLNHTASDTLEVLLVTSSSGKNWVFPKGGVELNMSERASAEKEVREEAGIIGIAGSKLSTYRYFKHGIMNQVTMYAMEMGTKAAVWDEQHKRLRKWFTVEQALELLDPYLAAVLMELDARVTANRVHEKRKEKQ